MILGFNEDFVPAIIAGTKIHTIRAGQRWRVGEIAQFVVRAGRPDQYEFWPSLPIVSIQDIKLTADEVRVDKRLLSPPELLALAQADGFASAADLFAFFAAQPLPFRGQLLHWTGLRY